MDVPDAKRLRELEAENAKHKTLLAEIAAPQLVRHDRGILVKSIVQQPIGMQVIHSEQFAASRE